MARTQIDPSLIPALYQNVANIADNGGFEIWQRGTSFSTPASGSFSADRWKVTLSGTPTFTLSKDTTGANVDTGLSSFSFNTTAVGGAAVLYLQQNIENYADFRGKTLTFSVRIKTSVAGRVQIMLQDSVSQNVSGFHSGSGNFETLSVTRTIDSATTLLIIEIGQLGNTAVSTGQFWADSAMLVVGSTAAVFVPTNPQQDLARCQRYFQVLGGDIGGENYIGTGQATAATSASFTIRLPVQMRTTPTATTNNATSFNTWRSAGAVDACTAVTATALAKSAIRIDTSSANLTAGNATLLYGNGTSATIFLSADL